MKHFCRNLVVLFSVVCLPVQASFAAVARDEVLRVVPEDVGFCLIVQNLRANARDFENSPFLAQLLLSPVGASLTKNAVIEKLFQLEKTVHQQVGISGSQLRDEIFGDCVAFAFRPAPKNQPEREQGVLVFYARDPRLLADAVARLNDVQKKAGDLVAVEGRLHRGVAYQCRQEPQRKNFYYINGSLCAFSAQETMIQAVIDRDRAAPKSAPALVEQLRRLGLPDEPAILWVNPRVFDADLVAKASAAKGAEALALERITTYWKALDVIAVSAALEKNELRLGLSFLAREGNLPDSARRFFASDPMPSDLWRRFPESAMFAMAGHLDLLEFSALLGDFLPKEVQRDLRVAVNKGVGAALGLDVFQDVLPNIGPDWGLCITVPDAQSDSSLPALLMAIRIRPGDKEKPVDRALLDGLNSLAVLAVLNHNKSNVEPMQLKRLADAKGEIRYLSGERVFPKGLQPAFALRDGYLLLASSTAAIQQFPVGTIAERGGAPDYPLARISIRAVRDYLRGHRAAVSQWVANQSAISSNEARNRLNAIIDWSGPFTSLEMSRRSTPGGVSLYCRLRTQAALKP